MNYKTELQANNADLQSILDAVNALPEAGANVETCTVNILDPDANYTDTPFVIHYVAYENGSVQMKYIFDPIKDQGDGTGFCELKNVVKGSKITFGDPKYECYPFVITGQYIENDCFVVDSEMLDNWQSPLLSTIVLGNADCWITPE